MLNERRVKHMVKLASYDSQNGEEEIKISSYFRKDYVSYNVVISLIWTTLAYVVMIAMLACMYVKDMLEKLAVLDIVLIVVAIIAAYVLMLVLYGVIAARHYKKKHRTAHDHVKKYLRNLDILEKMYEREDM